MDRYTIYCTEEQARKALELGAPIKIICPYTKINTKFDERVVVLSHSNVDSTNRTTYTLAETPTAEQIICWLEEQGFLISITACNTPDNPIYNYSINRGEESWSTFSSRKEATLAAIDAALEVLILTK